MNRQEEIYLKKIAENTVTKFIAGKTAKKDVEQLIASFSTTQLMEFYLICCKLERQYITEEANFFEKWETWKSRDRQINIKKKLHIHNRSAAISRLCEVLERSTDHSLRGAIRSLKHQ